MKPLLVILGPTASGKTALAVQACKRLDGELLSADSRQFYRGMDIGTGKDLKEFAVDDAQIPYHLIDIADAGETLNIYDFFRAYKKALEAVLDRGKLPVLCGGSGLYLETALRPNPFMAIPVNDELRSKLRSLDREALLAEFEQLSDKLRLRLDASTDKRTIRAIEIGKYLESHPEPSLSLPETQPTLIGIKIDRESRRKRITERLHQRLEEGLVEEVASIHNKGVSLERLKYYGLEYKCLALHLEGSLSLKEATRQLETEIHQFAKRQMTWFRGMERKGWDIHWISHDLTMEEKLLRIQEHIT